MQHPRAKRARRDRETGEDKEGVIESRPVVELGEAPRDDVLDVGQMQKGVPLQHPSAYIDRKTGEDTGGTLESRRVGLGEASPYDPDKEERRYRSRPRPLMVGEERGVGVGGLVRTLTSSSSSSSEALPPTLPSSSLSVRTVDGEEEYEEEEDRLDSDMRCARR